LVEYDVIIIGAGSVGVPTALATAENGLKTLVLDSFPPLPKGIISTLLGELEQPTHLKARSGYVKDQ